MWLAKPKHRLVMQAQHFAQCQLQMLAQGASSCFLVLWRLQHTRIWQVEVSLEWCKEALAILGQLIVQYILPKVPPPANFPKHLPVARATRNSWS